MKPHIIGVVKLIIHAIIWIMMAVLCLTSLIQVKVDCKEIKWTKWNYFGKKEIFNKYTQNNINFKNKIIHTNFDHVTEEYLRCRSTFENCCGIFSDRDLTEFCSLVFILLTRSNKKTQKFKIRRELINTFLLNSEHCQTINFSNHFYHKYKTSHNSHSFKNYSVIFMLSCNEFTGNLEKKIVEKGRNRWTLDIYGYKFYDNRICGEAVDRHNNSGSSRKCNSNYTKIDINKRDVSSNSFSHKITVSSASNEKNNRSNRFYERHTNFTDILPIIKVKENRVHQIGKPKNYVLSKRKLKPKYYNNTTNKKYFAATPIYMRTYGNIILSTTKATDYIKLPTHKSIFDKPKMEIKNITKSSNNLKEETNKNKFRTNNKVDSFPNLLEDTRTDNQISINSRFYPYMYGSPYMTAPIDTKYLINAVPLTYQKMPPYIMNPMINSYVQSTLPQYTQYMPNYFLPYRYKTFAEVTSPGGQYYICTPISPSTNSNNIVSIPGIEVRRETFNLQELMQTTPRYPEVSKATKLAAIMCPNGQQSCLDGSKCVNIKQVCDNKVDCQDASDEVILCSCKDRISSIRICDGFYDCPNGEDEQGCFGCVTNEFSCGDWSRTRRGTCISLEQRCDNIRHCTITGKDEEDCLALTDRIEQQPQHKISNTVGFLHRNYMGKWYPTCLGTELWATEICKTEAGPTVTNPMMQMMPILYEGGFINILPDNNLTVVQTCINSSAAYVECPPIYCGLRIIVKNPYRDQETITSAEEFFNEFDEDSKVNILSLQINGSQDISYDNILTTPRIVGGKPSQPAAWPWLTSIYKNGVFHCGGVLINELWVVTAAHCVDRYWIYYYEIGAGKLRRFSYSPMEQHRWATTVIMHKNYNRGILNNDIALMKLSAPIRYNKYVRPICLPSKTTAGYNFLREPLPGTICTTVGWGARIEHGSDPDHVREVEIPILNHCKNLEDQDEKQICAGLVEGGKDACQGDSGGPLMCRNPNNPSQWYLAGIVSHGEGCARPNQPGVYTRISRYTEWITDSINDENFVGKIPLQQCPGYVCNGINKCLPWKRRCDKIIDCLLGDDEIKCDEFHNVFKIFNRYQHIGLIRNNSSDASTTLKNTLLHRTEKSVSDRTNSGEVIKRTGGI